MNTFCRLEPLGYRDLTEILATASLSPPDATPELLAGVRRGHGIVYASWDPDRKVGRASAIGVVTDVQKTEQSITVAWCELDKTFTPTPQGRAKWEQYPSFKFDKEVAARYRLVDLFARHLPDKFRVSE